MLQPEVTARHFLLSVVMCTRNRAESLERVLNSICKMSIPAGQRWEMVLVDNGSTDETPQVVEKFKEKLPIRRVFEPNPGLSNARNAGVSAALGDYILWTDDDVEVDEGWLAAYAEAFARFPDGAVFGGRIIPKLETPSPAWFVDNLDVLRHLLAVRDFGNDYLPLSTRESILPYGANYAIRKMEQRQNFYDPELGVSPGKRRIGEETSVIKDILAAGHTGYWVPNAKVSHLISASRQTEKYVRDYFFGCGETVAFRALTLNQRTKSQLILYHGSRALPNIILFYAFRIFLQRRQSLKRLTVSSLHSGALNFLIKTRTGPTV